MSRGYLCNRGIAHAGWNGRVQALASAILPADGSHGRRAGGRCRRRPARLGGTGQHGPRRRLPGGPARSRAAVRDLPRVEGAHRLRHRGGPVHRSVRPDDPSMGAAGPPHGRRHGSHDRGGHRHRRGLQRDGPLRGLVHLGRTDRGRAGVPDLRPGRRHEAPQGDRGRPEEVRHHLGGHGGERAAEAGPRVVRLQEREDLRGVAASVGPAGPDGARRARCRRAGGRDPAQGTRHVAGAVHRVAAQAGRRGVGGGGEVPADRRRSRLGPPQDAIARWRTTCDIAELVPNV